MITCPHCYRKFPPAPWKDPMGMFLVGMAVAGVGIFVWFGVVGGP